MSVLDKTRGGFVGVPFYRAKEDLSIDICFEGKGKEVMVSLLSRSSTSIVFEIIYMLYLLSPNSFFSLRASMMDLKKK